MRRLKDERTITNAKRLFAFGPPPCGSNGNAKDPEER